MPLIYLQLPAHQNFPILNHKHTGKRHLAVALTTQRHERRSKTGYGIIGRSTLLDNLITVPHRKCGVFRAYETNMFQQDQYLLYRCLYSAPHQSGHECSYEENRLATLVVVSGDVKLLA